MEFDTSIIGPNLASTAGSSSEDKGNLLEVRGLSKVFRAHHRSGMRAVEQAVRAVDGIDLTIRRAETLGLVGESGCGKTTAGRTILRLIEPDSGTIHFNGTDLRALGKEQLRRARRDIGIVFQDPFAALDPRMLVRDIVTEPLSAHGLLHDRAETSARAEELLTSVGLQPEFAHRYPHEFSGGQRQRIGIARAIATNPRLLVLDEPISALDISIRAQILNLLQDLKEQRDFSYLFIAHDLTAVRHFCDRIAVMYLGIIVEEGAADAVFADPRHPYTRALLASAPDLDPEHRTRRRLLEGDPPSAAAVLSGCRFRDRCPLAAEICTLQVPPLRQIGTSGTATGDANRSAACHFAEIDTGVSGT